MSHQSDNRLFPLEAACIMVFINKVEIRRNAYLRGRG